MNLDLPSITVDGVEYCFHITAEGIDKVTEAGFDVRKPPAPEDLADNVRYWMACASAYSFISDSHGNLLPAGLSPEVWETMLGPYDLPRLAKPIRAAADAWNIAVPTEGGIQ